MDISARQKNTSCNDDMKTPASKRSTKYYMSYAQIRYLMKRLSTLEKKYMKRRNIMEQRCDKRKSFSSAKENSKTRKCSPLSSVAAKKVHANNKTE